MMIIQIIIGQPTKKQQIRHEPSMHPANLCVPVSNNLEIKLMIDSFLWGWLSGDLMKRLGASFKG